MNYKFGTWVITSDNTIGIIVEIRKETLDYFVKFSNGNGKLYTEQQLKEWHGCW